MQAGTQQVCGVGLGGGGLHAAAVCPAHGRAGATLPARALDPAPCPAHPTPPQSELGDVVYVELPEAGQSFKKGERLAIVESVKVRRGCCCLGGREGSF